MTVSAEDVGTLLKELFPIREGECSLELGSEEGASEDSQGSIRSVVRLFVWERSRQGLSIRDIKEQEVILVPAEHRERTDVLAAYLTGWAEAVRRIFLQGGVPAVEVLMPHDLCAPGVLKLSRPRTAEDFTKALLVRSRLGKCLG